MTTDNLIELEDVSFRHGSKLIFDKLSMAIPRGKITAIMGSSGTGKTTLLKLLCRQWLPTSGRIQVDGQNLLQLNTRELFALRKRMGMLFQSGALLSDLSVFENVAFPLREHTDLSAGIIRMIVLSKLQAVGLRGARDLMPNELSGGMARRVALARAIALDPMVIFYDEPFAGQDPISLGILVRLIKTLNQALNLTSIIVSHDVPETCSIADYVYLLGAGNIVDAGMPNLLQHSNNPATQQFLHGLPDGPVTFHYPAADYRQDLLELC